MTKTAWSAQNHHNIVKQILPDILTPLAPLEPRQLFFLYNIFHSLFTTHHLKRFHKISKTACYKIEIKATGNQGCHVINLVQLGYLRFRYTFNGLHVK